MAKKTKELTITLSKDTFKIFKKKGVSKKDFDFSGISIIRQILSNEKARILNIIKTKQPESIYSLAKILKRNFKSVFDDVKLLERVGFIVLVEEKKGKRISHKPKIIIENMILNFKI